MNPALSVILFTTLSGAGLGLWAWIGLRIALGNAAGPNEGFAWAGGLLLAALLVAVGLASSFLHLGKPLRAWRAFSQWRTSWLSREGVASVACFVVLAAVFLAGTAGWDRAWLRASAGLLALLALGTVHCTAMIYASLKPIPAWRHPLVVPGYFAFALLCGGLLYAAVSPSTGIGPGVTIALGALALATLLLKLAYWRAIDRGALPDSRGDAVGLPQRTVSVFERPHTEPNYITREMAFQVARRHARLLRVLAVVLACIVPLVMLLLAWMQPGTAWALPVAAAAALAGAFVERWLFFAEARHLVTLYY